MRTPEELRQLAKDIYEGKVAGTWNQRIYDHFDDVWGVLLMLIGKPFNFTENDAHAYEYIDKSIGWCNDLPGFTSMRILKKDEWAEVSRIHNEISDAVKKVMGSEASI